MIQYICMYDLWDLETLDKILLQERATPLSITRLAASSDVNAYGDMIGHRVP